MQRGLEAGGRRERPAGPARDVRALLDAIGRPGFPYSEIGARDRMAHAAAGVEAQLTRDDWARFTQLAREAPEGNDAPGPTAVRLREPGEGYAVAVASAARGAGRTTIAANLAHGVAALGRRCLAVDLDPGNALVPRRSADGPHRGIVDLALDPAVHGIELRSHGGVSWLPFGRAEGEPLARVEELARGDPGWLRRRVPALAPESEFIVLDTPAGDSPWLHHALRFADEVLVVVAPDGQAGAQVAAADRQLREHLREPGASGRVGFVINRFDPRRPSDRRVRAGLRALLGPRLRGVVYADAAVEQQLGGRRLMAEACPDSHAVADLAALAELLVARGDAALAAGASGRFEGDA